VGDRELILRRIRAAVKDVPATESAGAWSPVEDADPAVAYRRTSALSVGERAERFTDRCRDYAATVTRCADTPGAIAEAIITVTARHGVGLLAVPADLPPPWRPGAISLREDSVSAPLSLAELDAVDGVLTGCALAIADTGTIALDAGVAQGRRVLTLLPDLHICVVSAEQIVGSVPEAIGGLASAFAAGSPVTLISGPSATSDIELNRVEGVHGPRRLEVIVAG
jgi:L-lactate dehydrogenase complex protein LldG